MTLLGTHPRLKAIASKLAAIILLAGSFFLYSKLGDNFWPENRPARGDEDVLLANYESWKAKVRDSGGDRKLTLSLSPIRGLSNKFFQARGKLTLDLFDGTLLVEVYGLPKLEQFDVWLIDNLPGPGRNVKPERGDTMLRVGTLKGEGDGARLNTQLDRKNLKDFRLDLVVVAPAGNSPEDAAFLFGSPSLFQRLYHSAARGQVVNLGSDEAGSDARLVSFVSAPFQALIPNPAYADAGGQPNLRSLIARGRQLFFKQTFNGNGRTCGTCHPAENNFTLDADFIATLPPNDPLFVAEFVDALNSEKNGGRIFEIPALMRSKALIVENVDGFDDLTSKFVMRAIPHTLALSTSLEPAPDGTRVPPVERTGWSGDGAPQDGSLRAFIIGAIIQHYPLTLSRTAGVDFTLPTDDQLDALEAFQLTRGRSSELSLPLSFKAHLTDAILGQQIFMNNGSVPAIGAGKCNSCHQNAGANLTIANVGSFNFNFNTGVEAALQNLIPPDPRRKRDGGFGTDPDGGFTNVANPDGSFGNGTFNTPVLVESADTPPFFHNNLVDTIEQAVNFYNSVEFQASPAGGFLGGISLLNSEVNQVAAFLRVLNALENVRSVIASITEAKEERTLDKAKNFIKIALADCQDGMAVLTRADTALGVLDSDAVSHLQAAKGLLEKANVTSGKAPRNRLLNDAIGESQAARNRLVN